VPREELISVTVDRIACIRLVTPNNKQYLYDCCPYITSHHLCRIPPGGPEPTCRRNLAHGSHNKAKRWHCMTNYSMFGRPYQSVWLRYRSLPQHSRRQFTASWASLNEDHGRCIPPRAAEAEGGGPQPEFRRSKWSPSLDASSIGSDVHTHTHRVCFSQIYQERIAHPVVDRRQRIVLLPRSYRQGVSLSTATRTAYTTVRTWWRVVRMIDPCVCAGLARTDWVTWFVYCDVRCLCFQVGFNSSGYVSTATLRGAIVSMTVIRWCTTVFFCLLSAGRHRTGCAETCWNVQLTSVCNFTTIIDSRLFELRSCKFYGANFMHNNFILCFNNDQNVTSKILPVWIHDYDIIAVS